MDFEARFDDSVRRGTANKEAIRLAGHHCTHLALTPWGGGGRGLMEVATDLPLDMRRVECPVALGESAGSNYEQLALDFYASNCSNCSERRPTGQVPNLATLWEERDAADRSRNEAADAATRVAHAKWKERVARRMALRTLSDTLNVSALEEIDAVDVDPLLLGDVQVITTAVQRLVALATQAPGHFSDTTIDHLFSLVRDHQLFDLLDPLRQLANLQPELGVRAFQAAEEVLQSHPHTSAARTVADLEVLMERDGLAVSDAAVRNLIVLAGSRSTYRLSGFRPVVQSNDPTGLRAVANQRPSLVEEALRNMLPRPRPRGIHLPRTYVEPPHVSDLERQAAAGAIEELAQTHAQLTDRLLEDLISSLRVRVEDEYDVSIYGSAHRALAVMLLSGNDRVLTAVAESGAHATRAERQSLMTVIWQATGLLDPDERRSGRARLSISEAQAESMTGSLVGFLAQRLSGDWDADAVFEAADYLEGLARDNPQRMLPHLSSVVGALLDIVERSQQPTARSLLLGDQALASQDSADLFTSLNSLESGASRLTSAIEYMAAEDPVHVVDALVVTIASERDTDRCDEVTRRLIRALGTIGARQGDAPGVLQSILPTLHTYVVDVASGPRVAALEAWTNIASHHDLPSSLQDLLPVLVDDWIVGVADAVTAAATRLEWSAEDEKVLLLHAVKLMQSVDLSRHFDTFRRALGTARTLSNRRPDGDAVTARIEVVALNIAVKAELMDHQVSRLLDIAWQSRDAAESPQLARFRFRDLPRRTLGIRHGDAPEDALVAVLSSGKGLLGIDPATFVEVAAAHAPAYTFGVGEYVEIAMRVASPALAIDALKAAIERVPVQPSHRDELTILDLWLRFAEWNEIHRSHTDPAATETVLSALIAETSETSNGFVRHQCEEVAIRHYLRNELLGVPSSAAVKSVATPLVTAQPLEAVDAELAEDPASGPFIVRANNLLGAARVLRTRTPWHTHSGAYVRLLAQTAEVSAHLLLATAGRAHANLTLAEAHRDAARLRSTSIRDGVDEALPFGDPLGDEIRRLLSQLDQITELTDPRAQLPGADALLPLIQIHPEVEDRHGPDPWESRASDTDEDQPPIAVALLSIDGQLITGPSVLSPAVHTLSLEAHTDTWPDWAQSLNVAFLTHMHPSELQLPAWTWARGDESARPGTYLGQGPLQARFALAPTEPGLPIRLQMTWRGTDQDGQPKSLRADIAGHREFRLRPYDPVRDSTTAFPVLDERLLVLLERLALAGHNHQQLQAFARLLTAICREGAQMTWSKRYAKGTRVLEREFHNDLHNALLTDPNLHGRVDRGDSLALGYLDTRHDGITAELKVERRVPVTPDSARKYISQAAQYAAADGARLAILVILDLSPKTLPAGTPDDYVFLLEPQQHAIDESVVTSTVAVVIVNGNFPVPSWFSRRKPAHPWQPTIEDSSEHQSPAAQP